MPPRDFLDQGRIRLHERGTIALDDKPHLDASPLDLQRDVAGHLIADASERLQVDCETKGAAPQFNATDQGGERRIPFGWRRLGEADQSAPARVFSLGQRDGSRRFRHGRK
jgi:hypothetical protein